MDFQCFGFGNIAIPDTQIGVWVSDITFLAAPPPLPEWRAFWMAPVPVTDLCGVIISLREII